MRLAYAVLHLYKGNWRAELQNPFPAYEKTFVDPANFARGSDPDVAAGQQVADPGADAALADRGRAYRWAA